MSRDAFRDWGNFATTAPIYIFLTDVCCEQYGFVSYNITYE
jgi:hypothetical protein